MTVIIIGISAVGGAAISFSDNEIYETAFFNKDGVLYVARPFFYDGI